jgi:hypothetical protein
MMCDSSVAIVTDYELAGRGSISSRGRDFSLLHTVQIVSGAHPNSYPVGTAGSSVEVKLPVA